jgi:hypothetical protein
MVRLCSKPCLVIDTVLRLAGSASLGDDSSLGDQSVDTELICDSAGLATISSVSQHQ